MNKFTLLAFFVAFSHLAFGQKNATTPDTQLLTLKKIDAGPQGVGFTYEPKLSKKSTVDLSVGAGAGYTIQSGSFNYVGEVFKPALYLSATPKYFYNRDRRLRKGKTLHLNSGNYIGFRLKYVTPSISRETLTRTSILTNVHFGAQRAIGTNWTLNYHVGLGYGYDAFSNSGAVYPAIDFRFSYVFSDRKLRQPNLKN